MTASRRASDPAGGPTATHTGPVEDYLKAIYELECRGQGATATTSEIAHRLNIAPASVTGMVHRLSEQGLLEHEPYRGVRLTKAGQQVALRTIRHHRVIETFLTRMLGYQWDEVHGEAERLEHAASDTLIDRMAAALKEPGFDPHGAPIPTREGILHEPRCASIGDLGPGERARIVRVRGEDPARLRYLGELGLVPGAIVLVAARAPFDGPITVRVGSGPRAVDHAIGPGLGDGILVEPIPLKSK